MAGEPGPEREPGGAGAPLVRPLASPGPGLTPSALSPARALGLALALFLPLAVWVPVNRWPVPDAYFVVSLADGFQPRALLGTLARLSGLGAAGFVKLNLVAEVLLLALVLRELARSARSPVSRPLWLAGVAATAVLLLFHQVMAWSHFLSGFVDVHAYLLLLLALLASRRPGAAGLAAASGLEAVAVLVHEKAVFDASLLALAVALRRGPRAGALVLAGPLAVFLALLGGASEDARVGLAFFDYWRLLPRGLAFLREASGNLVGVFYGGGLAWGLAAWAAWRIARRAPRRRRVAVLAFSGVSAAVLFVPLLLAHDTNRLLGAMWFPTLVLLQEAGLPEMLARGRRAGAAVGLLAVAQLALPPVFVYRHEAVPLNCYAQATLRRLCSGQPDGEWRALGGFLRLSEDGGHRPFHQRHCPSFQLFRNSRPGRGWW